MQSEWLSMLMESIVSIVYVYFICQYFVNTVLVVSKSGIPLLKYIPNKISQIELIFLSVFVGLLHQLICFRFFPLICIIGGILPLY